MNPDKKVRRVQSLLYTSGVGVILFSIWTGLRGIESLFEVWNELRREYSTELESTVVSIVLYLFILAVLLNILSWSLYISQFTHGEMFEVKTLVYIMIDITSNIILIEVIVFSFLLKKMR